MFSIHSIILTLFVDVNHKLNYLIYLLVDLFKTSSNPTAIVVINVIITLFIVIASFKGNYNVTVYMEVVTYISFTVNLLNLFTTNFV